MVEEKPVSYLTTLKRDYVKRATEIYDFLGDKLSKVADYFSRGPYEIFYLSALGGITAFMLSYNHETTNGHTIPYAFSETSKIERTAKSMGIEVPVMTDYLSKTNDLCAKVFEGWNESWEETWLGNHTKKFAEKMEEKTDITFKTHKYEIPQLSKIVPVRGDSLLKELTNLKEMSKNLGYANNYLEKTWEDSHNDIYHTEYYTETETHTDSDGNTHTETVTKSKQVYDYTINTYTYKQIYGENSSKKLDDIIKWFPYLPLEIKILTAKETGPENEFAIERSRKNELEGKRLTQEEFLKLANSWAYGSQIYIDDRNLNKLHQYLKINAEQWRKAKKTAKSETIITYNYSHAEPDEFKVVESSLDNGTAFVKTVEGMLETIDFTRKNVPVLEQKINQLIQVELFYKKGDSDDLKDEIMNLSKKLYKANFPEGFNVDTANYGLTVLFTLLGLLAGAGLGFGLDCADNKYKIYNKIRKVLP